MKAQRGSLPLRVALFTGCKDRPYAVELAVALAARGVALDFIGDKTLDCPELHATPRLRFLDFEGIKRTSHITSVLFAMPRQVTALSFTFCGIAGSSTWIALS